MEGVERVINAFLAQIQSAAGANKLNEAGMQLLAGILAMLLIYNVLKTILEGASVRKLFAELIYLAMLAGFAIALLSDAFKLKDVMEGTARYVADAIAEGRAESGFDQAYQAVYVMFSAIETIFKMEAPPIEGSWWNVLGNSLTLFARFLIEGLLKVIVIAVLLVTGMITIAQFAVSQVMIYIAWILAPLFIPFLVWEQASFLFDGWMKFAIKAYFMKIVGIVMASLLANTIKTAAADIANLKEATNFVESGWIMTSSLLGMALIAAIICYLMWQIGAITDGLLSGSVRASYKFNIPNMRPGGFGGGKGGGGGGKGGGAGTGTGSGAGAGASAPPRQTSPAASKSP